MSIRQSHKLTPEQLLALSSSLDLDLPVSALEPEFKPNMIAREHKDTLFANVPEIPTEVVVADTERLVAVAFVIVPFVEFKLVKFPVVPVI